MPQTKAVAILRPRALWEELKELPFSEFCYYAAFACYSLMCGLERTTFEWFLFMPIDVFNVLLEVAALFLLAIKMLIQGSRPVNWLLSFFLVSIGFISWTQSSVGSLFWLALFVVCGKGIRIRPFAAVALLVTSIVLMVTVQFSFAGVIENIGIASGSSTRWALGFQHPNSLGVYALLVGISLSVLRFGKNPAPDIVVLLCISVFCWTVAYSRTASMLAIVQIAILLCFYNAKTKGTRRRLTIVFVAMIVVIAAFSFFAMVAYTPSNALLFKINDLMSGRLYLMHGYYELSPVSLFGFNFEAQAPIFHDEYGRPMFFIVDNAYCHVFLRYGLVPSALFFGGYAFLLRRAVKKKWWNVILFGLVIMAVYGFSESLASRCECNYFLLALGAELLYGSENYRLGVNDSSAQ